MAPRDRAAMWWERSGARDEASRALSPYCELVERALGEGGEQGRQREQVELDLLRTFPEMEEFARLDAPHVQKLRRVLCCQALVGPKGYIQGQNFLAAFILLVVGDEERAFWILAAVCRTLDRWFHQSLKSLRDDMVRFQALLAARAPALERHLRENGLEDLTLCCPKWFLCMYVTTLPHEAARCVWDGFFCCPKGKHVDYLFHIGVRLLQADRAALMGCTGVSELFTSLRDIGERAGSAAASFGSHVAQGKGESWGPGRERRRAAGDALKQGRKRKSVESVDGYESPRSPLAHISSTAASRRSSMEAASPLRPTKGLESGDENSPAKTGMNAVPMTPMSKSLWQWMHAPTPFKTPRHDLGAKRRRMPASPLARTPMGRPEAELVAAGSPRQSPFLGAWIEMGHMATPAGRTRPRNLR
mmetsp:Transcript_543/g.1447  ORF Transcript_543/g.1447 Transcript_543/m.1447 type:complete len:418 (-) Transcript_543:214-1467(-)